MNRKNLKKYLKIIGIYKFSQLTSGAIKKFSKIQREKILNSNIKDKRKNDLILRLDRTERLLNHLSEEEIVNILKKEKKQTYSFERDNFSSDYQESRSSRSKTGFDNLIGVIPKEQSFDDWFQSLIGFKLNGWFLFFLFLIFIPTPVFWVLFIFWLLRRERD
tara:strand:- start:901 stop:1386 length:486 start_codon:yes stop_codon:yes gene_type:complete